MNVKLYTYQACPYCEKVRQAFAEMGFDYEEVDAERGTPGSKALVELGGRQQVPFLVVEEGGEIVHQMYESNDIIDYAKQHFATN